MSSSMLLRFARAVTVSLEREGLLDVVDGGQDRLADHVATALGAVGTGSLLTELVRAFTTCDAVIELYADDDDLKRIIEDLSPSQARPG